MDEKFITCPYCREYISILLDTGAEGKVELIDDCEVCCRPIDISYNIVDFEIGNLTYRAIEGNEF